MKSKRWMVATALSTLAWGAAALAGAPADPPAPAPEAPDHPADGPREAPTRLPVEPAPPDGTFGGTLATPAGGIEVRVMVVGGLFVDGEARLPDGRRLTLESSGVPDTAHLRLGVRDGREYLQLGVAFFDAERGRGEFSGVLGNRRFGGQWTAERR